LTGTADFSVIAQGSTPIYYQWQFAGQNILRATNATFEVAGIGAGALGLYTVVASNLVSQVSFSATLGLAGAVALQSQPQSGTVHPGATATLSVSATGGPPPAYFWKFNGALMGASSNAISIPNFQAANEGTYSVLVSNRFGAVPSSDATLLLDTLRFRAPQLSGGVFQLHLSGVAGSTYVIETSTNLSTWIPLVSNNAANGFIDFSDTNAAANALRFYRAITN
ncbi:MAG TPA: immunoglobulin domain-containing protein, partial [Verrucomicrobiae bacterium]|nr:immunoglobulin domain-containing protein [Verrucomicrobiae bacterium]